MDAARRSGQHLISTMFTSIRNPPRERQAWSKRLNNPLRETHGPTAQQSSGSTTPPAHLADFQLPVGPGVASNEPLCIPVQAGGSAVGADNVHSRPHEVRRRERKLQPAQGVSTQAAGDRFEQLAPFLRHAQSASLAQPLGLGHRRHGCIHITLLSQLLAALRQVCTHIQHAGRQHAHSVSREPAVHGA